MRWFKRESLAMAVGVTLCATALATEPGPLPSSVESIGAAVHDRSLLLLHAGIFDPIATDRAAVASDHGVIGGASERYAIVQLHGTGRASREALQASGVSLIEYVPNNAYLVRLNGTAIETVSKLRDVRWAGQLLPLFKIDPSLWSANRDHGDYQLELRVFPDEDLDPLRRALSRLAAKIEFDAGANVSTRGASIRVVVTATQIDAVIDAASKLEAVQFIAPWVAPELSNSGSIGAIQGDAVGACGGAGVVCMATPLWDHGLLGSGQVIAVADSGLDADQAWFTTWVGRDGVPVTAISASDMPNPPATGRRFDANKVLGYWVQPGATAGDNNARCRPESAPTSFHGTHVSGTVAGDAAGVFGRDRYLPATSLDANHELADGMAPNAQLLFQDIGNDQTGCLEIRNLSGTLQQASTAGARVHNNSWGAPSFGRYTPPDAEVDRVTREQENLLVVVAAGNFGAFRPPNCPQANVDGNVCVRSVGSPAGAKNVMTVGALGHAGSTAIAAFSSRGPTSDGRIKPDIMAPGTDIVSATGDVVLTPQPQIPLMAVMSGTSMAAPTITGNAALTRQYFADGFYPRGDRTPADALNLSGMALKAVLLNGVRKLDDWPSTNTGWGRAWLDGNLWFSQTLPGGDDSRRLRLFERTNAAGLMLGQSHGYSIDGVQAGAELRATLTWFDLPASPAAAVALVNNLDLEVDAPGGVLYRGNVFRAGASDVGGNADALNTVEQVRLVVPVAGRYTFRVRGTAVPGDGTERSDRQGYALAVSGRFGLPDAAPLAAPTGLAVAANDRAGVSLRFNAVPRAQGFQLYRADGTCATAAVGDYRLVATSSASPLVDDRASQGQRYAYTIRGVQNDVEGSVSSCIDLVAADGCALGPSAFAVTGIDAHRTECGVRLAWSPSAASCPAANAVTYTVQRSDSPAFTAAQTLVSGGAGLEWLDTDVSHGRPYFYRLTATDALGNRRESSVVAATPSGADGPDPRAYLDDADTKAYAKLDESWHISSDFAADGSNSYHNGVPGPDCSAIRTEEIDVSRDSTLSFNARFDLKHRADGVVVEISTDGGSTWTDLPPEEGYPGSFARAEDGSMNACGYADGKGAFTGVSASAGADASHRSPTGAASFATFTRRLDAYAGRSVVLRWRMSSGTQGDRGGFWLDSIRVTDADHLFDDRFDVSTYVCH